MADSTQRKRKRRSTFSVVAIFLAVVALLAALEFYALWSSNRAHTQPGAPQAAVSAGTPARP